MALPGPRSAGHRVPPEFTATFEAQLGPLSGLEGPGQGDGKSVPASPGEESGGDAPEGESGGDGDGREIALARIAGPGVIPTLRSEGHGEVIAALLGNPRLSEDEVLLFCAPGSRCLRGSSRRSAAPSEMAPALPGEDGAPEEPPHARGDHPAVPGVPVHLRPEGNRLSHGGARLVRATAKQILESRPLVR